MGYRQSDDFLVRWFWGLKRQRQKPQPPIRRICPVCQIGELNADEICGNCEKDEKSLDTTPFNPLF